MSLHHRHKIRIEAAYDLKQCIKNWREKHSHITNTEVMTLLGTELYEFAKMMRNKEHDTPGQSYVE